LKAPYTSSETVYVNREYQHTSIRVMFGKPHSPWPAQQKPYVVVTKDGSFYDKFGGIHASDKNPAVHIPLEEFQLQW
jgi:hypothetical protein